MTGRGRPWSGRRPITLWLTGYPGAGKTTLAMALERRLAEAGVACHVLDGDDLRRGLNRDLGFTPADRHENIRRVAELAALLNRAGLTAIVAVLSPYRADRDMARSVVGPAFREIHVSTPLAVCESRDPKGMYAKARRGELRDFTGVSAPYEPPESPHLAVDTTDADVESSVDLVMGVVLAG
jgi:adenylyl-sulfate kinase